MQSEVDKGIQKTKALNNIETLVREWYLDNNSNLSTSLLASVTDFVKQIYYDYQKEVLQITKELENKSKQYCDIAYKLYQSDRDNSILKQLIEKNFIQKKELSQNLEETTLSLKNEQLKAQFQRETKQLLQCENHNLLQQINQKQSEIVQLGKNVQSLQNELKQKNQNYILSKQLIIQLKKECTNYQNNQKTIGISIQEQKQEIIKLKEVLQQKSALLEKYYTSEAIYNQDSFSDDHNYQTEKNDLQYFKDLQDNFNSTPDHFFLDKLSQENSYRSNSKNNNNLSERSGDCQSPAMKKYNNNEYLGITSSRIPRKKSLFQSSKLIPHHHQVKQNKINQQVQKKQFYLQNNRNCINIHLKDNGLCNQKTVKQTYNLMNLKLQNFTEQVLDLAKRKNYLMRNQCHLKINNVLEFQDQKSIEIQQKSLKIYKEKQNTKANNVQFSEDCSIPKNNNEICNQKLFDSIDLMEIKEINIFNKVQDKSIFMDKTQTKQMQTELIKTNSVTSQTNVCQDQLIQTQQSINDKVRTNNSIQTQASQQFNHNVLQSEIFQNDSKNQQSTLISSKSGNNNIKLKKLTNNKQVITENTSYTESEKSHSQVDNIEAKKNNTLNENNSQQFQFQEKLLLTTSHQFENILYTPIKNLAQEQDEGILPVTKIKKKKLQLNWDDTTIKQYSNNQTYQQTNQSNCFSNSQSTNLAKLIEWQKSQPPHTPKQPIFYTEKMNNNLKFFKKQQQADNNHYLIQNNQIFGHKKQYSCNLFSLIDSQFKQQSQQNELNKRFEDCLKKIQVPLKLKELKQKLIVSNTPNIKNIHIIQATNEINPLEKNQFMIWKKGIIQLNTGKYIKLKKNAQVCKDPQMIIIGNSEVTLRKDILWVRKKNQCSLVQGNLENGTWKIKFVQSYNIC